MKSKFIKSLLFSTIGLLSTSVVTPIVLSSCGKKIPVTGVKLNDNSIFLSLNGPNSFYKLTATILPENATNKNVSWSSSN